MKKRIIFIAVLLSIITFVSPINAETEKPCESKEGEDVVCIESALNGQSYKLTMMLPASYKAHSKKKYPVVYVLDGQWDFELVGSIYGKLFYDKDMPEVIIVGISWAGENINIDKLRFRDFVPKKKPNRGAGLFLRILEEELIPYVEDNYPSGKTRVITGSSLGGLFTTYAMLERPTLFNKVISLAPAYRFLKNKKDLLAKFQSKAKKLPIDFYLACGEFDGCNKSSKSLSKELENLDLNKFKHELHLIKGIKHAAITPIGNTHGLITVFN